MPYPIQNLLQGRGAPTTARPDDTVSSALAVMVEYDYSQLPVVDEHFKPLGMITYQSIVAAMDYFHPLTRSPIDPIAALRSIPRRAAQRHGERTTHTDSLR